VSLCASGPALRPQGSRYPDHQVRTDDTVAQQRAGAADATCNRELACPAAKKENNTRQGFIEDAEFDRLAAAPPCW